MSKDQYFAALPRDEIGPELMKRVQDWYTHISSSGVFSRMRKSYWAYYGYGNNTGGSSSDIVSGGVQGEIKLVKVNHYRNLLTHILVMTTNNRPAMEARSINTDRRSLAQAILANSILDYYMREKKLEEYLKNATENALIFGEGYIKMEWDATSGEEYIADDETGEITRSGDLKFESLNPINVIKDLNNESVDTEDWKIVRSQRNRFDLAAKFREIEDDILSLPSVFDDKTRFEFINKVTEDSPLVSMYEFFHRPTDALPQGRYVVLLDDDVILYDGPLPYKEVPIYRIAPGNFIGTVHGYSPGFDLLGLQEALDALYSSVVTNQTTFATQNILLPMGHNLNVSQIAGAMNILEYDSQVGKPEALQLTSTPQEVFNFIDKIEKTMETLSGVNEVARGNPSPNLRSGNALALIQSMAIQFNSGLQQSYARLIESVGTGLINTLKEFAEAPRLVMITGQANSSYMQEFVGNDLDKVNRVVVDIGNALSKTLAGKVEIADNLLQQGQVNAQQYLTLIKTGNLDVMYEGQVAELMLIKEENERMSHGEGVKAIATDKHSLHLQEHKAVLASPDARKDAAVLRATLEHINEHITMLRTVDPGLLQMMGEQPIPPAGQPGMPGMEGAPQGGANPLEALMGGGAPPGGPAPQPGQPPAAPQGGTAGVTQTQSLPGDQVSNMPSMPKNPLSQQKWDPQTGGLPPEGL